MKEGDAAWQSLCVDAAGPTKGSYGYQGGSTHEGEFTRK